MVLDFEMNLCSFTFPSSDFYFSLFSFFFDGTSGPVLGPILWISKTSGSSHFHKEFRVGLV